MIAQVGNTTQAVEDIRVRDELAATEGFELNESSRFTTLSCTDCAEVRRLRARLEELARLG